MWRQSYVNAADAGPLHRYPEDFHELQTASQVRASGTAKAARIPGPVT